MGLLTQGHKVHMGRSLLSNAGFQRPDKKVHSFWREEGACVFSQLV